MSATWKFEGAGGPDDDVATETVACVERTAARVTVEWRREMKDGRREVTAARFKPDGTLLGAWRGPPGGTGAPLRIVRRDPEEALRQAQRRGAPLGLSPDDAKSSSTTAREVVETPAGRFRCEVVRHEVVFMLATVEMTYAYTDEPLPLSPIVRMAWSGMGMDWLQELVTVSRTGAAPSLAIPE